MKCHIENVRQIFHKGVQSVQPATIFSATKCFQRVRTSENREVLQICSERLEIDENKKCHLVGFGKAVLGMAVQVERILADRLVSGIISIPVGTVEKFSSVPPDLRLSVNSVVRVFEGALNNLPDRNAMEAAVKIKKLAESMTSNDVLFVLISGGGSSLLPLPIAPITLEQKLSLVGALSRKGADIEELNIVRIAISETKGGKLAEAAKRAHKVFSLVISDIVNDPLHLIASGPTVEFKSDGRTARYILEKYQIWDEIDDVMKGVILRKPSGLKEFKNNSTCVIGSNKIAAQACLSQARLLGYKACILSTSIVGSLQELTTKYTDFLLKLKQFLLGEIDRAGFTSNYPLEWHSMAELLATIESCNPGELLCLILAGEPTAQITGNGKGGRNQELALRMARAFYRNRDLKEVNFLSAGTDGIDGPTDSAGAIGCIEVVDEFLKTHTMADLEDFLSRNDSYHFYKSLDSKKFHISPGHTGTNVMDLHIITIPGRT